MYKSYDTSYLSHVIFTESAQRVRARECMYKVIVVVFCLDFIHFFKFPLTFIEMSILRVLLLFVMQLN